MNHDMDDNMKIALAAEIASRALNTFPSSYPMPKDNSEDAVFKRIVHLLSMVDSTEMDEINAESGRIFVRKENLRKELYLKLT